MVRKRKFQLHGEPLLSSAGPPSSSRSIFSLSPGNIGLSHSLIPAIITVNMISLVREGCGGCGTEGVFCELLQPRPSAVMIP